MSKRRVYLGRGVFVQARKFMKWRRLRGKRKYKCELKSGKIEYKARNTSPEVKTEAF